MDTGIIFLSPELLLLIAIAVFGVLFIIVIWLVLRNNEFLRRMATSGHEDPVRRAHEEAQMIVWNAMEEAKKLRVSAELEGLKSLAKEKLEVKKIEEEYKKTLDALIRKTAVSLEGYNKEIEEELKKMGVFAKAEFEKQAPAFKSEINEAKTGIHESLRSLEKSLKEVGIMYTKFVASLQEVTREQFEKDRLKIQEEYSKVPEKLEVAIADLKEEGKKVIEARFNEEFKKAHGLIEKYRNNYLAFLDTSIVSLLEETTEIVLEKRLSLKEHADLALRALEEAKKRGVFGLKGAQK